MINHNIWGFFFCLFVQIFNFSEISKFFQRNFKIDRNISEYFDGDLLPFYFLSPVTLIHRRYVYFAVRFSQLELLRLSSHFSTVICSLLVSGYIFFQALLCFLPWQEGEGDRALQQRSRSWRRGHRCRRSVSHSPAFPVLRPAWTQPAGRQSFCGEEPWVGIWYVKGVEFLFQFFIGKHLTFFLFQLVYINWALSHQQPSLLSTVTLQRIWINRSYNDV